MSEAAQRIPLSALEPAALPRGPALWALTQDVAEFLYREADLLDRRRFTEWLALLEEDLTYFMPMRRNVRFGQHAAREDTRQGEGISWFDEDKWTLGKRVEQILTGVHYAEEPLSRVCHMVSAVQVLAASPTVDDAREVTVRSRFLIHQNRVETETSQFIGKRTDVLRRHGDDWRLAAREITLDQSVLLAKNLTVFF